MAQFTKVNGTTQPVFALDVANGSISGTANVAAQGPVMLSGPQLQFFTLTANAALTNAGNVNGYLNNVLQAVQSGAGLLNCLQHIVQVTVDVTSIGKCSVCCE